MRFAFQKQCYKFLMYLTVDCPKVESESGAELRPVGAFDAAGVSFVQILIHVMLLTFFLMLNQLQQWRNKQNNEAENHVFFQTFYFFFFASKFAFPYLLPVFFVFEFTVGDMSSQSFQVLLNYGVMLTCMRHEGGMN